MTYTTEPAEDPARHAWQALSIVGTPMELAFIQEHNGDLSGFWRFRYFDRKAGIMRVGHFRADAVSSVAQECVDDFWQLKRNLGRTQDLLCRMQELYADMEQGRVPLSTGRRTFRRLDRLAKELMESSPACELPPSDELKPMPRLQTGGRCRPKANGGARPGHFTK